MSEKRIPLKQVKRGKKQRERISEDSPVYQIYKLFIAPLLALRKEDGNETVDQWIKEKIFHIDERAIGRYKARQPFKMPGLYRLTMTRSVQGIGARQVKYRNEIWVRTDSTKPNQVEIEAYIDGGKEHHFLLTDEEFARIKKYLRPTRDPV